MSPDPGAPDGAFLFAAVLAPALSGLLGLVRRRRRGGEGFAALRRFPRAGRAARRALVPA